MMTRSENVTLGELIGIPLPVVLRLLLLLIRLLIRLRIRLVVPMPILCCMLRRWLLLRWLLLRWLLLLPCLGCLIISKILRFLLVLCIGLRVIGLRVCFAAFSDKLKLICSPPHSIYLDVSDLHRNE